MTGNHTAAQMRSRPVSALLTLPIRLGGIHLGRPVEAFVGQTGHLIGFEVVRRDGTHCFLPLAAADVRDDEIVVSSALVLDERIAPYYREHSLTLADLGLADPWIAEDGTVREALSAA